MTASEARVSGGGPEVGWRRFWGCFLGCFFDLRIARRQVLSGTIARDRLLAASAAATTSTSASTFAASGSRTGLTAATALAACRSICGWLFRISRCFGSRWWIRGGPRLRLGHDHRSGQSEPQNSDKHGDYPTSNFSLRQHPDNSLIVICGKTPVPWPQTIWTAVRIGTTPSVIERFLFAFGWFVTYALYVGLRDSSKAPDARFGP